MMKLFVPHVFVDVHCVLIQQDAPVVGLVLMTTYLGAYRQQARHLMTPMPGVMMFWHIVCDPRLGVWDRVWSHN